MTLLICLLLCGLVALALFVGRLWGAVEELAHAQRALQRIDQGAADALSRIRAQRARAEEQLRRFDRQEW